MSSGSWTDWGPGNPVWEDLEEERPYITGVGTTWVLQQATHDGWEDKAFGSMDEMMELAVAGDSDRGINGCAAHRIIHRKEVDDATYGEDAPSSGS